MKGSLLKKIVAAVVGVTLLTLVVSLLLARWSFEVGFLDYLNAREAERLSLLSDRLAQRYKALGRWPTLGEDPLLREIDRSSLVRPPPPRHIKRQ